MAFLHGLDAFVGAYWPGCVGVPLLAAVLIYFVTRAAKHSDKDR
jgi:hypothetical protein